MSQHEKLKNRLISVPKDFTWSELIKVLGYYGFEEFTGGKTGGSRRKFVNKNNNVISLHKPHPGQIVKQYALREVIEQLKAKGHI